MMLRAPEDLRALMGIPFDERQLAAITADLHPAVIMAGAGSGKTTVMAARVVWLVGTGQVEPAEVLGLTFTNKAAGELAARVRQALARLPLAADSGEHTTIATYHAFAQRLIGDYGIRLGFEPDTTLLSDVRREQLAMAVVRHPDIDLRALSTHTHSVVRGVLQLDDALAELAVEPEALVAHDEELLRRMGRHDQRVIGRRMMETAAKRLEFAALVMQFRRRKRESHVIDYADMGRLALRLAETRPDVVAELRLTHRVVLLDEYQDTSVTQRLLMQRLFGDGHSVMAVGDPLQAIYEWRGASMRNILDFPIHFPLHLEDGTTLPASVFGLPATRRFGTRIGAVANAITADLREQLARVEPLAALGDEQHGAGSSEVAFHDTQEAEFAWLAQRLRAQHERQGIGWERMAVLVREHRHTADIHRALVAADIPVQILGKQGILSIPDIADIVAYLRVIADPAANPSWVRILGSPRIRLGLRDVAILGRRAADLARDPRGQERAEGWEAALAAAASGSDPIDLAALGDAIADPGDRDEYPLSDEARRRLAGLAAEIEALRRRAGWPIVDLVREVLHTTGLHVEIAATEHALQRGRRVMLDAFLELVATFTALDDAPTLPAFLRWLRDGESLENEARIEQPQRRDAVSIMTVHSAKGLQWDVVALPTLVDGVFPSRQAEPQWPTAPTRLPFALLREPMEPELQEFALLDPADEQQVLVPSPKADEAFRAACRPRAVAEEVRLAYVAVTRAHRHLIASGARHYGERTAREPSPFLETLREAALAGMGEVSVWAAAADVDAAPEPVRASWPAALDPQYERWLSAAAAAVRSEATLPVGLPLRAGEAELVEIWDEAARHLVARRRAAATPPAVPAPRALSTTALQQATSDPDGFLRGLVRPMPKQPARAARRGSAFHLWVEQRFGQQALLDREEFAVDREDDTELETLKAGFRATPWADAVPMAVELPFTLLVAGVLLRGRIDAVYRDPQDPGRIIVIDWKTNRREDADPLQLSVYRHAVAAHYGIAPQQTRGAFVYVASGNTVFHDELAPLADLVARVTPRP